MDATTFELYHSSKLLGETRADFLKRLASGDIVKAA